jgi:hypothetical protein
MATIRVTGRRQITLDDEVLAHLGIGPGETLVVKMLPKRQIALRTARVSRKVPTGHISDFFGILAGRTTKVATIEEINRATAEGWAGLVR